jgi:PAS domain S-box-containing protein
MSAMPEIPKPRAQGRWTAVAVLVLALGVTAFGVWREQEIARRGQVIRWQDGFAQLQPVLAPLLGQRFETLHDQARSRLRRNDASAPWWDDFVAASEWRQRFPGMMEIGYAEFGGDHCTVRFLASEQTPPVHAPGFDLNRDPIIRDAVQKSADAGYGVPSREIALGGKTDSPRVIIGLLPLQIHGRRPGTAAENRANLQGFIFFALNQPEYFRSIQPQLKGLPLDLRLLAAEEAAPPKTPTQRPFSNTQASGEWRFVAMMKPSPASANASPWIVLIGGSALSFLLCFLFTAQSRLRFESEQANESILQRDAEITALNHGLEQKIAARTAELHKANEHLEQFRAVIEATTDLVGMADLEGRTLYLNQAGRRMMEFPAGLDVTSLTMSQFFPDDVNRFFMEVALPQAMRDGFWAGETRVLTWNQGEIPVSFVGSVIKSADGKPLHLACIARDISERKKAEQELHRALAEEQELNRLKSNFISMVTHEIRTPLALILGSSEILSRYLDRLAPEKRAGHLRTIDSAVQRMSALLEDVLLFSKAEAGRMDFNPVQMDLKTFCTQLVDELVSATNRRCPIELSVSAIDEAARADEGLLRHVLSNLIANAAKYSPAGTPVKVAVTRAAGDAVFIVQDHGMGIPENDRKRLFTPFYRGKNVATIQGTGLGLVIVKHCVERHGGTIEVESEENAGTTVTVRLPLFSPAHTEFIKRISETQTE